ncbi:MAG: SDR family NAD(P)-dependent oxidoreductase, partial [bacterium]
MPTVVLCNVEGETVRKLSTKRPVAVFSDESAVTKAFLTELDSLRIPWHVFTSHKSRTKNHSTVDWTDLASVEKEISAFAKAHPDVQGVLYLLGCEQKKLDKNTQPHEDLVRLGMPLFLAAKHFNPGLSTPDENHSTFLAVVTKVDGAFGYRTDSPFDPICGAVSGITYCLRKELEKSAVKLVDFSPETSPSVTAKKTMYEIMDSDRRLAVGYHSGKRWTLISKPSVLPKEKGRDLKGRTILVTGAGRGLGAEFCRILAERFQPRLLMLDIIALDDNAAQWAVMSDEQLKELKSSMWAQLKASASGRTVEKDTGGTAALSASALPYSRPLALSGGAGALKVLSDGAGGKQATPVILEREFTKVKDAIQLHRTIENLKKLGSETAYFNCDLNDHAAVRELTHRIKTEYRKIDGLVHFAGFERSKLATDKTVDEFFRVYDTKATSAGLLLKYDIVKEEGFWGLISSIAGRFGNVGQTDYAAASDYLSKLAISLTNKGMRAVAVDMSAYADIGMAMRPGVEAFLKSQGVDFLCPEEGMQALTDELVYGRTPEIVLSGNLGSLDWDKQLEYVQGTAGGQNGPFMEKVTRLARNKELLVSKEFSLEKDPYLKDHSIQGTPYVPGVMGLEIFAEAAGLLTGKTPVGLEHVSFSLPVKLLRNKPVEARIKAVWKGDAADIKIESDFINPSGLKMGKPRTHFTARTVAAGDPAPLWNVMKKPQTPVLKYSIGRETIYKAYFHGPSFRVLDGIVSIDPKNVTAIYKKPAAPLWNDPCKKPVFHPMLIEAAFQTCGYNDLHFAKRMSLPDAIGRVLVYRNQEDADMLFIHSSFKGRDNAGKSVYDAFVFDETGRLWVELNDYVMI